MKNKDLTVSSPLKTIWLYCLPLIGSVLFQQFYNLADSLIAGNFISELALASIGNSYEITLIFLAFSIGLNIASSIIISSFFGAKNYKGVKEAISTILITSVMICIVLMVLGYYLEIPLLDLIKTPSEIKSDSITYLNIYIASLPFIFAYNIANGIFSALGDSKTPFVFLVVSSIGNIILDLVFTINFNLGVMGLALATFICQAIAAIISILVVIRRINGLNIEEKTKVFNFDIFKSFMYVAIPSILQQSFISIGNIIIQGIINPFGGEVIAGYSAAIKLNNLVITAFTAIGNGISNYTSQNLGANKIGRVKHSIIDGYTLIIAFSIPVVILYEFFPELMVSFFISSPSEGALSSSTMFLKIVAPFYFVGGLKLISDGVLRGSKYMVGFMIGTFTDLVIRVVLSYIFALKWGYNAIWYSWIIGWSIGMIISIVAFSYNYIFKQPKKQNL